MLVPAGRLAAARRGRDGKAMSDHRNDLPAQPEGFLPIPSEDLLDRLTMKNHGEPFDLDRAVRYLDETDEVFQQHVDRFFRDLLTK